MHKRGSKMSFSVVRSHVEPATKMLRGKRIDLLQSTFGKFAFKCTRDVSKLIVGDITKLTFSREPDGWYVSIAFETATMPTKDVHPAEFDVVGLDMNVGTGSGPIASNGVHTKHPYPKDRVLSLERKIERAQRELSRKQRRTPYVKHDGTQGYRPSKNYIKAKEQLARLSQKWSRTIEDWQHKLSRDLVRDADVVVLEDLNLKGMTATAKGTFQKPGRNVAQKAGLNRSILRTGFAALRSRIEYKGSWYGANVGTVSQWFPSSKTCSSCGHVNKSPLEDYHVFVCESCTHTEDRDINAAKNLQNEGFKRLREEFLRQSSHEVPGVTRELTAVETK